MGSVSKTGSTVRVEMRLYRVASRQQLYAREYSGSAANPRLYAHTIADEMHESQRQLRGVARTKLTFSSDRNKERVTGTVENRDVKEVYIGDYDGANQRRITVNRQLNITPVWSPDGAIDRLHVVSQRLPRHLRLDDLSGHDGDADQGRSGQNWLPMFSPDGTRLAFTSNRDGNPELYIMNVDGSNIRRLTNHPAIDTTPTWSPTGTQIAFTSDRGGAPSIWVVGVDGLGLRRMSFDNSDRPTWSPAPYNEIAYAARTGPGLRHQDPEHRRRRHAADHVRRRQQREPGVGAERPPSRVHVHARRQDAGVHRGSRRQERAADHARRQQPAAATGRNNDVRSAKSGVRSPCEVRSAKFVRSASACEVHDGRPRSGRSSDRPIERV